MSVPRRRLLQLAGAATAVAALPRSAAALDYPTRPIRWVVGFPPGGGADIVARLMARWLSERLGQEVIIENRPGAATNIAAQNVISSPPDGYSLLWIGTSNAINTSLYHNLPFSFVRDVAPVAGMVVYPLVLEVHPSVATDLAQFIALAKANPGRINYGSYGTGTTSHVAGELFKTMAGVEMIHVPYRGGAQMLADLVGGQLQVGIDVLTGPLQQIRAGGVRALGIGSKTRSEFLPDVPAIGETVPGYEANSWCGIGVPRGTPPEIIERLNREINAGLANAAIKKRYQDVATTPLFYSPAEFGAYIASEADKWSKVVKRAGIKPE